MQQGGKSINYVVTLGNVALIASKADREKYSNATGKFHRNAMAQIFSLRATKPSLGQEKRQRERHREKCLLTLEQQTDTPCSTGDLAEL